MPEPICSASQPNDLASIDPSTDDLTCSVPAPSATAPAATAPNQSLASGASSQSSVQSGVSQLVDRYSQKDYSALIASSSAAGSTSSSAPSTGGGTFYVETHDTPDDHSVLGAVWAKHGPTGHVEILSASVQAGAEEGAQIGVAHAAGQTSVLGLNVSGSADAATLRINLGERNDDGSTGANVAALATLGGAELTVEHSGWSGTFGLSASLGAAVSSGTRDVDGDGVPERCFKASIGPATLGVCTEL
ncbi:MAG TPA: hypothetical protein VNW92_03845 [Polyangiaceae bacterium]|jgi:hypothetical protein|nr:hypothetical protein [Polyangiaceae bacterium]